MNKFIFVFFFLVFSILGRSATWIVDTDEAGNAPTIGTQTLEMALNNAVDGDTILIDYSGSLALASTLNINVGVTIMGPAPIHWSFDGSSAGPGPAIAVNAAGATVRFENVTFENYNSNSNMMTVNSVGLIEFKKCQFSNNTSTSGGGAAIGLGSNSANFFNTSFYQNSAPSGAGGAVFKGSGGVAFFEGCSFLSNSATEGGGVFADGNATFIHCTFYNNSAVAGGAVRTEAAATDVRFESCFFDPSNSNNVTDPTSVTNSLGHNLLNDDLGSPGAFTGPGDIVSGGATFGLRPTGPKQDGYGLWWIPITDPASNARNAGGPSSHPRDGRRAPRILEGTSDIGAIEYTPYRVFTTGTNPTVPGTFAYAIQQSGIDGAAPAYISFDISGSAVIASTASFVSSTGPMFIDGYTQEGSQVHGPRNVSSRFTGSITPVIFDGMGSTSPFLVFVPGYNDNEVSGLTMFDYSVGIRLDSDGNYIFGNHFGTNDDGTQVFAAIGHGVRGDSSSNNQIGGSRPYERNLFGSCNSHGILFQGGSSANGAFGNIFGLTGDGVGSLSGLVPPPEYIRFESVTQPDIESNIMGFGNTGISVINCDDPIVAYNVIGFEGDTAQAAPMVAGIVLDNANLGAVSENDIGNCAGIGITLNNSTNVIVNHNHVGVTGDGFSAASNDIGVFLDGTINASIDGNLISANSSHGIRLTNGSDANDILANIIGLDASITAANNLGNGTGILVENSANNIVGNAGSPNTISDNVNDGIEITGSGSTGNAMNNNAIGVEGDLITPAGNGLNGISISLFASGNQIGTVVANTIGNNGNDGVSLSGDAASNIISGNSIFSNTRGGIWADGTSTSFNTYTENEIFSNGDLGIRNDVGANQSVQAPEILGATECAGATTVRLKLNGLALGNAYTIEFFLIPNGDEDPSGFGEGDNYHETITHTATVNGTEEITLSLSSLVSSPDLISATITHSNGNTSEFSNHFFVQPDLSVALNGTGNESCAGSSNGSIDINYSGGSGTIGFIWHDSGGVPIGQNVEDPIGLIGDDYYVDITDTAGCTITSPFYTVSTGVLSMVASVSSNYNGEDVSCNGATDGEITFTSSGGTNSYDVSLDGGSTFITTGAGATHIETGVAAGTYTPYIIDGNTGCDFTAPGITVTEPPVLTTSLTPTDETCNGASDGSINAIPSGGTPGYTNDWFSDAGLTINIGSGNPLTGLTQGTYYHRITDSNGCTFSSSATVAGPAPLVYESPTLANPGCNGTSDGSITLAASGGTPGYLYSIDGGVSFQASASFSGLTAGTYSTVIEDVNGCLVNGSETLVYSPAVEISVTHTDVSCFGGSDGTGTITITSGSAAPFAFSSDGGITQQAFGVFTGLSAGTYTFWVADNGFCTDDTVITIIEPAAQLLSTSSSTFESCLGADDGTLTITVTGGTGPYDYNWYTDAGYTSLIYGLNSGSLSETETGVPPGMYYPEIVDANGCLHYAGSETINTGTVITSNIAGTDELCPGSLDGTAVVTPSGGTGPYSATWFDDQAMTNNIGSNLSVSGLTGQWYYVMITDMGGSCTSVDSIQISSPPAVGWSVLGTTNPSCAGVNDGTANVNPTGGDGGPYSVSWSPSGETTSNPVGLHDGWNVAFIQDGNGCSYVDSVFVTAPPAPSVLAGADADVCETGSYTLGASFNNAGGVNWTSTGTGSFLPNSNDPNATYIPSPSDAGSTIVLTVTTTGNGACPADQDDLDLIVEAAPDAGIDWSLTMCSDTAAFDLYNEIPGAPDAGGNWDPGLNSGTNSYDPITDGAGTYLYIVSGTNCPNDTSFATLTVNPASDATISAAGPFCVNYGAVTLSAATNGGTWSGTGITNGAAGTFDPAVAGAGTWTVTYTITGSCPDTDTEDIIVNPFADPTITSVGAYFCATDAPFNYVAASSGGTWSGPGIMNSSTGLFDPSATGDGTFTITYTSAGGCGGSDDELITVKDPSSSIVEVLPTCNGDSDGEIEVTYIGSTGTGWDVSINGGATWQSNSVIMGSVENYTGLSAGSYQIIVGDQTYGCYDTTNFVLNEPAPISFLVSAADDTCSLGIGRIVFTNLSGGTPPFEFSTDAGTTSQTNPSFNGLTSGMYDLQIEDQNGCIITDIASVGDQIASLSGLFSISANALIGCPGDEIQLNATPAGSYNWSPNVSDPTIQNPTITLENDSNRVYLDLTIGACSGSDTLALFINSNCESLVEVSNAFSPDGDGFNDTWVIDAAYDHPENTVAIFNRWGDLIVEFENYDNMSVVWDGKSKGGEELPSGTYYYTIDFDDLRQSVSGWVYITN